MKRKDVELIVWHDLFTMLKDKYLNGNDSDSIMNALIDAYAYSHNINIED